MARRARGLEETDVREAALWPAEPTREAVLDALAARKARRPAEEPDLLAAAGRWGRRLDPRRSRREPVDLWVGGAFHRPRERELWAWSILSGGGLILPGNDPRRVGTILWARPTVASGDRFEISRLVQGLQERKLPRLMAWSRRLRRERILPLGRLHSLVGTGPEPVGEDDRAWLEAAGVRVLHDSQEAAP